MRSWLFFSHVWWHLLFKSLFIWKSEWHSKDFSVQVHPSKGLTTKTRTIWSREEEELPLEFPIQVPESQGLVLYPLFPDTISGSWIRIVRWLKHKTCTLIGEVLIFEQSNLLCYNIHPSHVWWLTDSVSSTGKSQTFSQIEKKKKIIKSRYDDRLTEHCR